MARRLDSRSPEFADELHTVVHAVRDDAGDVAATVADIIAAVRERGLAAIEHYTHKFDHFRLTKENIRVGEEEVAAAEAAAAPEALAALRFAAERIRAHHEKQRPIDYSYTDEKGVKLGWRWNAVDAAGLYAPGGRAAYPSSVLMNAIPAAVAGVKRLVMCAPAPGGEFNPLVLAAARLAGVHEIYRVGGAQAIAAMAYGAGGIAPVDVIVGPGNAYVAEAKRQVFGRVGIDAIAGPSEILVVADARNDPAWIAADLLSQAEHDPTSQSVLITDDSGFADAVEAAVEEQLAASPRREIAGASWKSNGVVIVVSSLDAAPAIVDLFAPEHLELAIAKPEALAAKVRHAGAIFLGRHTPEAVGDYVAGPDHVLPTGRAARFSSGLSVLSFMKRTSLIGCDAGSLVKIGPPAATLADAEGLPSHADSIRRRLG